MKKIIFSLLCLLTVTLVTAQPEYSDRFLNAMKKNITAIDSSYTNPANFLTLSSSFERIALAEKNQWLAYYYAAFCQINYCFAQEDKSTADALADKAEQFVNKADSLNPQNAELSCLRSMIATARLMVNPMQRYMQYGQESEKQLKLAMAQDTSNPRPYFLKAQSIRFTPEQFGGGCKSAIPVYQEAIVKFNAFKPATELHPNWGRQPAEKTLQECQK